MLLMAILYDSMRERLEKKCNLLFYLVCEDKSVLITAYMKGMVNKGITMKSYIKSEKFYGIIGLPPFPTGSGQSPAGA